MIDKDGISIIFMVLVVLILFGIFFNWLSGSPTTCIKTWFDSDKYCQFQYYSNFSNSGGEYKIFSHLEDKVNQENANRQAKERELEAKKVQDCFDKGNYYNFSFDIFKDYDFNCKKLEYINNHLIDKSRQVDGGYISGDYSGFLGLSHGSINGQLYQYVTEGVLATGQLVKNISYHLDCQNTTYDTSNQDTKVINYYSESEFVMYYVNKCVN